MLSLVFKNYDSAHRVSLLVHRSLSNQISTFELVRGHNSLQEEGSSELNEVSSSNTSVGSTNSTTLDANNSNNIDQTKPKGHKKKFRIVIRKHTKTVASRALNNSIAINSLKSANQTYQTTDQTEQSPNKSQPQQKAQAQAQARSLGNSISQFPVPILKPSWLEGKEFELNEVHFHIGTNAHDGSEHTFDGQAFAAEVCIENTFNSNTFSFLAKCLINSILPYSFCFVKISHLLDLDSSKTYQA